MNHDNFLEKFIDFSGIRPFEGLKSSDPVGGFSICLDRGEKYSDMDYLSENEIELRMESDREKFEARYFYVWEQLKVFCLTNSLTLQPYFDLDDKGHFFICGRVIPKNNLYDIVVNLSEKKIIELLNKGLKSSDDFRLGLDGAHRASKDGEFSLKITSERLGELVLVGAVRFVQMLDGKISIEGLSTKRQVDLTEIETSIESVGESMIFKVSQYYKNKY